MKHDDKKKEGRELRYNDTAETASREMADEVRRGEARVVPDMGAGVGEAAGALGGAAAGGTVGMLVLGPIGAGIAAIAGALGGWWGSSATDTAAQTFTPEEDAYYRERFETSPNRVADRSYEQVRPAYQLGHVAAHNPAYRGKRFAEIEPELTHAWPKEMRARYGEWSGMRGYVREAYERRSAASAAQPAETRATSSEQQGSRERPDAERDNG